MAKDIFERLSSRSQQAKKTTDQPRKRGDLVARWKRKTEAEAFLTSLLADGPMPAAIIEELGAARKFSKTLLWHTKQRIGAVAFKKKGKFVGGWIWALVQHENRPAQQSSLVILVRFATSQNRRALGYVQSAGQQPRQAIRTRNPRRIPSGQSNHTRISGLTKSLVSKTHGFPGDSPAKTPGARPFSLLE